MSSSLREHEQEPGLQQGPKGFLVNLPTLSSLIVGWQGSSS